MSLKSSLSLAIVFLNLCSHEAHVTGFQVQPTLEQLVRAPTAIIYGRVRGSKVEGKIVQQVPGDALLGTAPIPHMEFHVEIEVDVLEYIRVPKTLSKEFPRRAQRVSFRYLFYEILSPAEGGERRDSVSDEMRLKFQSRLEVISAGIKKSQGKRAIFIAYASGAAGQRPFQFEAAKLREIRALMPL